MASYQGKEIVFEPNYEYFCCPWSFLLSEWAGKFDLLSHSPLLHPSILHLELDPVTSSILYPLV